MTHEYVPEIHVPAGVEVSLVEEVGLHQAGVVWVELDHVWGRWWAALPVLYAVRLQ